MAHDIFISHSSEDKTSADAVCSILESEGLRCWIAPRDILPGSEWTESILNGINGARAIVLIFSQHANDSPQVRREVERGVSHGIPIVPVRIQDVMPTRAMEYLISTPHWMDAIAPPLEAHIRQLAGSLRTLIKIPTDIPATGSEDAKTRSAPNQTSRHSDSARANSAPADSAGGIRVPIPAMVALGVLVLICAAAVIYLKGHNTPAKNDSTAQAPPSAGPTDSTKVATQVTPPQNTTLATTPAPTNEPTPPVSPPPGQPGAGPVITDASRAANSAPVQNSDGSQEAGISQFKAGDYAGAIATLTKVINSNKADAYTYMYRGIASVKLDVDQDGRRGDLQQAIRMNDKLTLAYVWLSLDSDDLKKSMEYARTAVRLDPNSADAHAALGFINGRIGDFPNGVAEGEHAHQMDPQDILGMLTAAASGDQATMELCGEVVKKDPNFVWGYLSLDVACKGNREIILHNADVLMKISPTSAMAAEGRAIAAMVSLKFEDACVASEEAVRLRPTSAGYHVTAASAYFFCRQYGPAKVHVDKALELQPVFVDATNVKAQIEAALANSH